MKTNSIITVILLLSQIINAQPTITSFSPSAGPIGTLVTINGNNFSSNISNNIVYFGAVKANIQSATANTLLVTVPAGATLSPISVTTNNLIGYSSQFFNVTFPGVNNINSNSFSPATYFNTDSWPTNELAYDMDGDGKADIINFNEFNYTFTIERNISTSGNINFAPKVEYYNLAWQGGSKIAIGDIDGDGKLDIAIYGGADFNIYIFLNTSTPGNISFTQTNVFSNSVGASGLFFADLDMDGRPDLVTYNNSPRIAIFKNTSSQGKISFATSIVFGFNAGYCVLPGDFDNDGKIDLAVANNAGNTVSIYKNTTVNGAFSFAPAQNFPTGTSPKYMAIGDFDNDNKLDLVVTYEGSSTISAFKNTTTGTISFNPRSDMTFLPNYPILSINAGNINGDSKPDLLVGQQGYLNATVLQNISTSSFIAFNLATPYAVGQQANSSVICDLDNDGKADISTTNNYSYSLSVLRNRVGEPIISSFNPIGGPTGTLITIKGTGFTGTTTVSFGNIAASAFNVINDSTITATVGSGSTGSVTVTTPYGTNSLSGFTFGPPPVINSFSPTSQKQGGLVTIKGTHFLGTSTLSFGNIAAQNFWVINDTIIYGYVGAGTSGNINISNPTGNATIVGFNFLFPPKVNSVSPNAAFSGTNILIKGQYFTNTTSINLGGVPLNSFNVLNDSTISAIVGNGTTGFVNITTPNGTTYSNVFFSYLGPNITSVSPQSAGAGATITIRGYNLSGATAVNFGGTPATSFIVVSDSVVTAITGIVSTGDVTVTTPTGIGTLVNGYTASPIITSFSPTSGTVGSTLTITGNNFNIYNPQVFFGNAKANIISINPTSITVSVPPYSTCSPISVNINGLYAYSKSPFITTFNGALLTSAAFTLPISLKNNDTQNSFAVGDLNGDGKPDVILCNTSSGLSIFNNNSNVGNLQFSNAYTFPVTYPTYNPSGVILSDFNGDGKLDIAVINNDNNKISLYANYTYSNSYNFPIRIDLASAGSVVAIACGDIDGDGKPDIVAVNYKSNTISVFRNTTPTNYSNFTFAPKIDFATGVNPKAVILTDLNNDGKIDIAVANEGSNTVSIFKNKSVSGNISIAPKVDYATGNTPRSVTSTDLDADGFTDLIIGNAVDSSITLYKNSSTLDTIIVGSRLNYNTSPGSNNVTVNDFDGDGKPDISVGGILKNTSSNGNISLAAKVGIPTNNNPAYNFSADLDGDGKPDLLTLSYTISIYRNKMNEAPIIKSFSPTTVGPGDSIIIIGNKFTGATSVNYGNNPFSSFYLLSDTSIVAFVGNNSGDSIFVTTPYGTASLAGLKIQNCPIISSFTPTTGPVGTIVTIKGSHFSNASNTYSKVMFGNVGANVTSQSDSNLTVLVPPGANNTHISVTQNSRAAYSSQFFNITFPGATGGFFPYNFDTTTVLAVPTTPEVDGFDIGDLDGDGKQDIAISGLDYAKDTLGIYHYRTYLATYNNITSSNKIKFSPVKYQMIASPTYQVKIVDLNGDGKPDLASDVVGQVMAGFCFFRNNSALNNINLGLDSIVSIGTGTTGILTYVYTGDFDGDGRPDLLLHLAYTWARYPFSNGFYLYRNIGTANGKIIYSAPIFIQNSNINGSLMIDDFNNDGKIDIAAVNYGAITVFPNTSTPGAISFGTALNFGNAMSNGPYNGFVTDIDGDGKNDIVLANPNYKNLLILRNNSTSQNFSFDNTISLPTGITPYQIKMADLDGDGKPDLCINNGMKNTDYPNTYIEPPKTFELGLIKNLSTPGVISFSNETDFPTRNLDKLVIADMDNDGKPDIITTYDTAKVISILRNTIGEPVPFLICPPVGSTVLNSNISGNLYQWQVNTGTGFNNLSDNSYYTNSNGGSLQLTNIPSSWYGYQYKCMADGNSSYTFLLNFSDSWIGTTNSAWENPSNWNCGTVPEANTDVIINSGTIVINSNVTIRSLTINPGVKLTVINGFTLTVLH